MTAGFSAVFLAVLLSVLSYEGILPVLADERRSYYRECASQTYHTVWYFVGLTIVESPYVMTSCFVFCAVFFPLVGFSGASTFFLIVGMMMNTISCLFSGFSPPAAVVPSGYKWFYDVVPSKFTIGILASLVFGDCPDASSSNLGCKPLRGELPPSVTPGTTVKDYMKRIYLIDRDEIVTVIVIYDLLDSDDGAELVQATQRHNRQSAGMGS